MRKKQDLPLIEPETADDIVFPEPNSDGEGDLPLIAGTALLAARLTLGLKELREAGGMTTQELVERSGLDEATISRLELGRLFNPRLDTLSRYALALGYEIEANLVPIDPEYRD